MCVRGTMPKSATCSAQRCSASLNTPQVSRFRGRTAPFLQVRFAGAAVSAACLALICCRILQIRKRQASKRNHQLQTSAVFDYCSTARGHAVSLQHLTLNICGPTLLALPNMSTQCTNHVAFHQQPSRNPIYTGVSKVLQSCSSQAHSEAPKHLSCSFYGPT